MSDIKDKFYLALDQGGHASRALLFDNNGVVVDSFYREISTRQTGEDIVEHDAGQFIRSVVEVIEDVVTHHGSKLERISCAGLATQRSSIVCWRKSNGQPLSPVISWQDRRTQHVLDRYRHSEELIRERTGLMLNAHYGASKMRWCLENIDVVKQADEENDLVIAPVASFILFHILEHQPLVIDPANAGRTLLFGYQRGDWDQDLLDLFGIERRILPRCVDTVSDFGSLSLGSATKLALTVCTGDQSAAVFASGMPRSDFLYCNAGTGAFVQQVLEEEASPPTDGLLRSIVFSNDVTRLLVKEGTVNGAGRALNWFAQQHNIRDFESVLETPLEDVPAFINGIAGLGSPFWRSDIESSFERDVSEQQALMAILESIVFLLYCNIVLFSGVKRVVLSGGLSGNTLFCQYLADLTGLQVDRREEKEATGVGLFMLLSGNSAVKDDVERSFAPHKNLQLTHRYVHWRELLEQQLG